MRSVDERLRALESSADFGGELFRFVLADGTRVPVENPVFAFGERGSGEGQGRFVEFGGVRAVDVETAPGVTGNQVAPEYMDMIRFVLFGIESKEWKREGTV